ncbi:hypothetical protein LCGC14_2082190, partial [marine sediment metagenome]
AGRGKGFPHIRIRFWIWLGDDFDPEYFDKDEINQLLRGMKRFAKPE